MIWKNRNSSFSCFASSYHLIIFWFLTLHRPWIWTKQLFLLAYKHKFTCLCVCKDMVNACMQTSLESPTTLIPVNPLLRAYLNPKIIARYSATLLVAIPNPSRNLQNYKRKQVYLLIMIKKNTSSKIIGYIPHFHQEFVARLLHQIVLDFLYMHHQTQEYTQAVN